MAEAVMSGHEHHDVPDRGGGALNAAIARAVVRIHHDQAGRGPTRAQALHRREVVVVLLRDTMTRSERTLAEAGRHEAVLDARRTLQEVIQPLLAAAVAELTAATVEAVLFANSLDPDLTAAVFVLGRPIGADDA
jgi:uncharacterized protein YbcI